MHLVPLDDVVSIRLISDYFQREYRGTKVIKVWPSGSFDIPTSENLIAVGGPFVNSVAKQYIDNICVDEFDIDKDIVAHLGEHSYKAKLDEKGHVVVDYGFAFCLKAPNSEAQRVLLLFGLWSQGTHAATEAAVGLTGSSKKRRQFRKLVASKHDAIAVLRSGGTGSASFQNVFEHVQEVRLKLSP